MELFQRCRQGMGCPVVLAEPTLLFRQDHVGEGDA